AEDTRVTRTLLDRYNIPTEMIAYHQHSNQARIDHIVELLRQGKHLALVSDAGTPGINDPGGMLVAKVLIELPETKVIPIPGANAALTALSVSGFPADRFTYLGFPPHKKGRQTFFKSISGIEHTVVFYESKHRFAKMLADLRDVAKIGRRQIVIARELTKQFETLYRGTIEEIVEKVPVKQILGEFVIVIGPHKKIHHGEKE
ncbi:MAG: 16S rRNA (cytidine(1402)-2'-O)-methyltransferase, partial [Patescibacteria group bacterium]